MITDNILTLETRDVASIRLFGLVKFIYLNVSMKSCSESFTQNNILL